MTRKTDHRNAHNFLCRSVEPEQEIITKLNSLGFTQTIKAERWGAQTMRPQVECTLLNLIRTLNELTDNDQEVVTTATYLINSGRVRLCGSFTGAKITFPVFVSIPSAQEL